MSRTTNYTPATTVIDPTAPGGIEAMLAFHRATFGDAQMNAAGGDPAPSGDPTPGSAPAPTPAPAPPAPTPTPAPPTPAGDDTKPGGEPWDDPAKAKAEIERLRRENASERVNAKKAAADEARKDLAQQVGKALGLVDDDTEIDPAQLAAETEQLRNENRITRVELAVYRAAAKHQGDPDALLDSRTFLAKVADLDPKGEDFTTQLDDAIKQALVDNPKLKTAPAAGASSVNHAGGTGETAVTQERFDAMSPAEKNKLYVTNPTLYRQLAGR